MANLCRKVTRETVVDQPCNQTTTPDIRLHQWFAPRPVYPDHRQRIAVVTPPILSTGPQRRNTAGTMKTRNDAGLLRTPRVNESLLELIEYDYE